MAKKFNIHDWQQKHLFEQDEFTPDLEDDDLKRSKIQQMMNTEKGLQKDDYKLVNSISNVAEMYSYGEILDALESFYIKNDEQQSAEMVRKHAKEFRDFLGPDVDSPSEEYSEIEKAWDNLSYDEQINIIGDAMNGEPRPSDYEKDFDQLKSEIPDFESAIANYVGLDENVTGTGASFTAGDGMGHFGKKKKKAPYRKSGYMGYSEPVKEQEEEPAVDDKGTPTVATTALELASQLKSLSSALKTPKGGKGFDASEIRIFSEIILGVTEAIKTGSATSILKRVANIIN